MDDDAADLISLAQDSGYEALWCVQTAPWPAWGGRCPGPRWLDTEPGIVDLWAAPSKGAPVAAAAGADGAIFEQDQAPLTQRWGWAPVGFRLFGVETDLGGTDMACAWGELAG